MNKTLLAIAVIGASISFAEAQVERSGGSANAQVMQQLQQLASERTQLQAENARLREELDSLRKERARIESSRDQAERNARTLQSAAARAQAQSGSAQAELEQGRARMQELTVKFREVAGSLRDVESERTSLTGSLSRREAELASCTDHNVKLYDINVEILTRFADRGFWSALSAKEPFMQLKRVELDNLVEGYRARAEDHQIPSAQRH